METTQSLSAPIADASIPSGIHLLAKAGPALDRSDADMLLRELAEGAALPATTSSATLSATPSASLAPTPISASGDHAPGRFQLITIHRSEQSRPRLFIGDVEMPVSLTHTKHLLIAAMGTRGWIGVDAEHIDRHVHEGLHQRMMHPSEASDADIRNLPEIRLWTLKEAVLKWMGTGLKTPMNSIQIRRNTSERYECVTPEGEKVHLASFRWWDHWVSLAWSQAPDAPGHEAPGHQAPADPSPIDGWPMPASISETGDRT